LLVKKKRLPGLEEGAFRGFLFFSVTPLAYLPPRNPGGGCSGCNCWVHIHCIFYT